MVERGDGAPSPDRRQAGERRRAPRGEDRTRWIEQPADTPVREAAPRRARPPSGRKLDQALSREIAAVVGPRQARRVEERVSEAAAALDADRPRDALRALRPILAPASDVAVVRELAGLASYRLGRWQEAIDHLAAFERITASTDQHPVLADANRALGRYDVVNELWEELRESSPSGALVTEGRIVVAGALADQGKVREAIALLERGMPKPRRTVHEHHLRLLYVLADLYERAGDAPRARELFTRVAQADPALADTAERLQALS